MEWQDVAPSESLSRACAPLAEPSSASGDAWARFLPLGPFARKWTNELGCIIAFHSALPCLAARFSAVGRNIFRRNICRHMAAAGADATFRAHLSWRQYCQTPLCSTLRKCAPPQGFMPRPPFLPQKACGAARKAQYFHRPQPPAASPLCKAFFPVRRDKSCCPAGKCVAEARPSPLRLGEPTAKVLR